MRSPVLLLAWLTLGIASGGSGEAQAAENAAGIYLLGSKSSMAGFVPPPGIYVVDLNYFYAGDAGGAAAAGIALRRGGNITVEADVEVDANAYLNIPTALWIAPGKVLGGNVGLGILAPVGWKDIGVDLDVLATLTLPDGTTLQAGRQFSFDDSTTDFGDPLLNALIGWHRGNWHWNLGALLNVPIGPWSTDSISNISFHRWALDTTAAVTWLDPKSGFEVSSAAGFTFNWENPDTDYETGTEFHVEWALLKHFSRTFAAGVMGYHYQQVTGDSGAGARLGDFKGRATALGPTVTYSFQLGNIPVSTQMMWLHEFDVKNRAEGDVGLLTITIPLSGSGG